MKKTVFILVLALLLTSFSGTALAADEEYYVWDYAGLLSAEECDTLEEMASELSESYACGVYIMTVDDYSEYVDGSIADFTECMRAELGFGYGGEGGNCVMLALSMAQRDYDIMAYGSTGNAAFTDYGKQVLADEFLDDFADDDWYGGFYDYLESAGELLEAESSGAPVDVNTGYISENDKPKVMAFGIVASLLIAALIAFIVCAILKSGMKSVRQGAAAHEYITPEGVELRVKTDVFTHSTRVERQIESKSSGGGTSVNSSGHSHSSGKF